MSVELHNIFTRKVNNTIADGNNIYYILFSLLSFIIFIIFRTTGPDQLSNFGRTL